jgi:outer membrane biosynthesis protein TonB
LTVPGVFSAKKPCLEETMARGKPKPQAEKPKADKKPEAKEEAKPEEAKLPASEEKAAEPKPQAEKPKAQPRAKQKGFLVRSARQRGFWRIGKKFTLEPKFVPLDKLSDAQVAELKASNPKFLVVEEAEA